MNNPDERQTDLEADPRFPSGEWTGFFLQPRFYSGKMKMSLSLKFRNSKITGNGTDIVGDFFMRGKYDVSSGEVRIHKRYLSVIDVYCKGYAEAQHKGIWGVWEIAQFDTGGFHIWPLADGEERNLAVGGEADLTIEHVVFDDEPLPAAADVG